MMIVRVLKYFRSQWPRLVVVTVVASAGALLDAISVVLIVALADAVSRGETMLDGEIGPIGVTLHTSAAASLAVAAIVGTVMAMYFVSIIRARMVTRWARDRRRGLVDAFLAAEWELQSRDKAGSMQTILSYTGYASTLIGSLVTAARGAIGLLILIGTAFLFDAMAAAGLVVVGGLVIAVLRPINNAVRRRSAHVARISRTLNEDIGEMAALAKEIRVYGAEDAFRKRVGRPVDDLMTAERRVSVLASLATPIYQAMTLSLIVLGLVAASTFETIDVAVLGVIALLMLRSISYGQQLQGAVTSIHQAAPAIDIIDEAIDELDAARVRYGARLLDDVSTIDLDCVTFSYGGAEVALREVTTRFERGEIVGLVGPSGSGKSTLSQLLLRLRQSQTGDLLVNGLQAREYAPDSWSRHVTLVPQDTHLLHGSVHDNIAFLRPGITRDEVTEAARAAGIHEAITDLPDGYDTIVGPGARELSGGQRQRIGIARALVGRPSVIVLDEPTSALDQHSEALVQQTLENLRGQALVIVIAHRLTTLSICDRVIILVDGAIELEGPPLEVDGLSPHFQLSVQTAPDDESLIS